LLHKTDRFQIGPVSITSEEPHQTGPLEVNNFSHWETYIEVPGCRFREREDSVLMLSQKHPQIQ